MVKMSLFDRLMVCCCGEQGTDESDLPYEPLNDNEIASVRSRVIDHAHFREVAHDLREPSPAPQSSLEGSRTDVAVKSKKEEEEEALNAIIDNTQLNIIDMSQLENPEMLAGELVMRQRKYEEAVKSHDARFSRNGVSSSPKIPGVIRGLTGSLLEDSSSRVSDWLGRPPLPRRRIASAVETAQKVEQALNTSVTVTSTKPLIVHMDL